MFGLRRAVTRTFRRAVGVDIWIERALAIPVGQVSLTEARFLGELVRSLRATGPIVEIGTLFGWTARIITLNKDPGRELITVDGYFWNPLGLAPDDHSRVT